jgi:hypothetical protein
VARERLKKKHAFQQNVGDRFAVVLELDETQICVVENRFAVFFFKTVTNGWYQTHRTCFANVSNQQRFFPIHLRLQQ